MKQAILDMIHMNLEYTGNGMYMAIYFITIAFVAFYLKDKHIKERLLLPNILMLIGINIVVPVAHNFIMTIYDDEIRGRFFWILMVPAIAAIGMTIFVTGLDNEKMRYIAILCMFPIIFYCGVFKISNSMYSKVENAYRLPESVIELSERVLELKESPRLIVPYETAHVYRQYSSDIYLLYGEDATYGRIYGAEEILKEACSQMATSFPDLKFIHELSKERNVDFIVFDCVYQDFGNTETVNTDGYTEDVNFVGDREPIVDTSGFLIPDVINENDEVYWDLSGYGFDYVDTFGQYLLYSVE